MGSARDVSDRGESPRTNRVAPTGEIIATTLRGAWTGNRGILHRDGEIARFHAGNLWITCRLEFKGWRLKQWQPGHFTVLFFHDEAVSLAAGHRPCALCRREDYNAYRQAWATAHRSLPPSAADMNRRLHSERLYRGTHRRRLHQLPWDMVPSGAFTLHDGPVLVCGNVIVPWTRDGYLAPRPRPTGGIASVLTPPASLAALSAGYAPQIDPSAMSATRQSVAPLP